MVLIFITFFSAPLLAADLSRIDRKVAKEPAYTSRPEYCLLVFGPEAKTRVWIVQDGNNIYVDRNGNGDLTETGEKATRQKDPMLGDDEFSFAVGDIRDGDLTHKRLMIEVRKLDHLAHQDEQVKDYIAKDPKARGYRVVLDVEMRGFRGIGIGRRGLQSVGFGDLHGFLKFSDTPETAPIIHFGGPWQVTLYGHHRLTIGRETDLVLALGTPGIGAGTTAWVGYEGVVPEQVFATAEVTYPPAREGEPSVRELYELKKRC
jgi:hypothetical protein